MIKSKISFEIKNEFKLNKMKEGKLMLRYLKCRLFILILISSIILSGCNETNQHTAQNSDRNKINKNPISQIDGKDTPSKTSLKVVSRNSNDLISKEKGLEIVTSKVKIEMGIKVLYDSEWKIYGRTYYLYTLNKDEYTLDQYAYCVDVNNGKLFKCLNNMILIPII